MLHCHMLTHEDQGMMLQFEVVDLSTGTRPGQTNPDLVKVYPNPVKEGNTTLTISGFTSEKVLLGLYNMQGQKISEKNLVTNKEPFTIKLPGILPGTYLLKLNGGNIIHTTKIVVE